MTPVQITQMQQRFVQLATLRFPNCRIVTQAHDGQRIIADILQPVDHPFVSFLVPDYLYLARILVDSGFPPLELRGGQKFQIYDTVNLDGLIMNEQYISSYSRRMVVPIDRLLRDQLDRRGQRTADMFRLF